MHNFLVTLFIVLFALLSITISSNLSTHARSSQYLKEDIEIAVHDASLQIDNEQLADGLIMFDLPEAQRVFKESLESNTGMTSNDYRIVDFQAFDYSNSTFPVEYTSTNADFDDTFLYPTIVAIVETTTGSYFFTSNENKISRVASYSYKIKNKNPIISNPVVDSTPNINGFHWVVPYTNNITSHFNPYRLNPVTGEVVAHKGTDIASNGVLNTPALSALDGRVTYAGSMGAYGNLVEITHGNGLVTRYGHLNAINVSNGEQVEGGQVIGLIGSTGRSTGAHLHFETIYNGKHVDPLTFY